MPQPPPPAAFGALGVPSSAQAGTGLPSGFTLPGAQPPGQIGSLVGAQDSSLGFGRGLASAQITASSPPSLGQLGQVSGAPAAFGSSSLTGLGLGGVPAPGGPGQLSTSAPGAAPGVSATPTDGQGVNMTSALDKLGLILAKLDGHLSVLASTGLASVALLPVDHEVRALLRQAGSLATIATQREETALAMVQMVVKRLYEQAAPASPSSRLCTQANVQVIAAIGQSCNKVARFVTDMLFYSDEERKLNPEVTPALLSAGLISMSELSSHLSSSIDGGRNRNVVAFCVRLLRIALVDERFCSPADASELLVTLGKLAAGPSPPNGLLRLVEDINRTVGPLEPGLLPNSAKSDAPSQASMDVREAVAARVRTAPAPPTEADKAALLHTQDTLRAIWDEWMSLSEQENGSDKSHSAFLTNLQAGGWLRDDTQVGAFLKHTVDVSMAASFVPPGSETKPSLNFAPLDALSKLATLILKMMGADGSATAPSATDRSKGAAPKPAAQLAFLSLLLTVLVQHLVKSHDRAPHLFNQRPYLRLFGTLLFDLNAPDPLLDLMQPQALSAFGAALHALNPTRLPGFAFSWLELVSHRMFMPKLLLAKGQCGWPVLQRLLVLLFSFLHPFLSTGELSTPTRALYRGSLRVLLVLLHDFPEFLCGYHYVLCDVIPSTCIQMRNLVLSAFPRYMRLPDPFTPNLKVDLLPDITQPPRMLSPISEPLAAVGLQADVDAFIGSRQPVSFLAELSSRLYGRDGKPTPALVSSLVLHIGCSAVTMLQASGAAQPQALAHSAPVDIMQRLATDLCPEGRCVALSGMSARLLGSRIPAADTGRRAFPDTAGICCSTPLQTSCATRTTTHTTSHVCSSTSLSSRTTSAYKSRSRACWWSG